MQNQTNRLSPKSDTLVQAYQQAADESTIHPEMSANDLADVLSQQSQPKLAVILLRKFYATAIRAERRKQSAADRAQYLLPGFEHLPLKISTRDRKKLNLLDANYRRVRDYYWLLKRRQSDRNGNDRKIAEAKALMDLMQKHAAKDERITVREVILLDK